MADPESGPDPRQVIEQSLDDSGAEWESPAPGHYVVKLPGTRKLSTTCSLVVGSHSLSVNAFVVRRPDENHAGIHRWLLERNTRLYGVAFATDRLGDIYLVGRLPHAAVTPDELDRILGTVLEQADGTFNTLLEMGFATAIRKEHAWRTARGESTRNLDAFAHLVKHGDADWTSDRIGSAARGENPTVLRRLSAGYAVIGDVQFLPGYALLLADDPGAGTLTDLPPERRLAFLSDMDRLGEAVTRACRRIDPAFRRVNLEILGNTDPFLHAHVWPRYEWEPAELIGKPVWLYPQDRWHDERHALGPRHDPLREAIGEELDRLAG
jgi:diadenosine tetraphosphate (Ap4A) HIT family hydrolase